ncbi:MAG: hypothetical protein DSZ27_00170 [Thiomicrospira sp.]|nr:MAG: hypothetical protein DSZ27_00170 [Thiomicrospira sp.]
MGDITAKYLEMARNEVTRQLSEKAGKFTKATDYKLSKVLGISTSAIHYYLKEERECDDDDIIFTIAYYAQVDPMQIIGAIRAKRAKNEEVKNFWTKAAKGGVAGFGALALASTLNLAPTESQAADFEKDNVLSIHYANIW